MSKITNEQVVNAYLQANREGAKLRDIADRLGVSPQYLDWRAKLLRKAGVKIPKKFSPPVDPSEVVALNRIIEESLDV